MKKLTQLLTILCALSLSQVGANQTRSDKITVRISVGKQQYAVREQVQVAVQVENQSDQPLIISSLISNSADLEGYVEFTLTDTVGRSQSPQMRVIADTFGPFPKEPDWRLLFGQWIVLNPEDSISSHLALNAATFPFLTKPGRYKISAVYSSAGLSYPLNYRRMGLTAEDVASLRFPAWSGKVRSNSVWITIVPAHIPPGKQQ